MRWIPAFAGMTDGGKVALRAAWAPAFAGETGRVRGRRVEYGGDGWSAGVGVRETGEEGDCGSVGSRGDYRLSPE